MKTFAKISVLLSMGVFSIGASFAQTAKNDPSYSTSNYKQPNKAAYTKSLQEKQPTVYMTEVKETSEPKEENNFTASANYKVVSPSKAKIKHFRLASKPTTTSGKSYNQIPANYKMPYSTTRKAHKIEQVEPASQPIVAN